MKWLLLSQFIIQTLVRSAGGGCNKFCLTTIWRKTAVLQGAMVTVLKALSPKLIDGLLAVYKKSEDLGKHWTIHPVRDPEVNFTVVAGELACFWHESWRFSSRFLHFSFSERTLVVSFIELPLSGWAPLGSARGSLWRKYRAWHPPLDRYCPRHKSTSL